MRLGYSDSAAGLALVDPVRNRSAAPLAQRHPGALAPVLWYNGVRAAPAALSASAMGVMPLSALSLSYLLLGEAFRWVHLVGFGLVFAGLILMIVEHASGED